MSRTEDTYNTCKTEDTVRPRTHTCLEPQYTEGTHTSARIRLVSLLFPCGGYLGEHVVAAVEGDHAQHEQVAQCTEHVHVQPEQAEQREDRCRKYKCVNTTYCKGAQWDTITSVSTTYCKGTQWGTFTSVSTQHIAREHNCCCKIYIQIQ